MRDCRSCGARATRSARRFDNTSVIEEGRILNPEGIRYTDEFVRHKVLDAIGDLALAGAPLIGAYRSFCGGHKLNHAVLNALMADRSAWAYVEMPETRRPRGHADLARASRLRPTPPRFPRHPDPGSGQRLDRPRLGTRSRTPLTFLPLCALIRAESPP